MKINQKIKQALGVFIQQKTTVTYMPWIKLPLLLKRQMNTTWNYA